MARPKGKLFALLAIFAAIGLVTATGAFTTVAADRTASVDAAGDENAYLALEPHGNSENGADAYAQTTAGQLELLLDGSSGGSNFASGFEGSGVNLDARTEIDGVFNITNQGTQPVGVWIVKSGDNSNLVEFYDQNGNQIDNSSTAAQTLSQGETMQVSIVIDTRGSGLTQSDTILDSIEVHADADQAA